MVGGDAPDADEDSLNEPLSSYTGSGPTDYGSFPDGLPPHIRDGFDEKSGGYSPAQVYAANGVWDVALEREPWEVREDGQQVRIEAFA